jgi:hypothetical protein
MNNRFSFSFPASNTILEVILKKTIRVPNDEQIHPLPKGLGDISYYVNGEQFIVPINHEKEALWFWFEMLGKDCPVAIKVLAGRMNALTGETEDDQTYTTLRNNNEAGSGQNYLIVPGQPWLDGFMTADKKVRQFIVVTLGQGNSVEEKLEGTQRGGIQIVVIPIKQEIVLEKRAQRLKEEAEKKEFDDSMAELNSKLPASEPEEELIDYEDEGTTYSYRNTITVQGLESTSEIDHPHKKSKTSASISEQPAFVRMGLGAGGQIEQEIIASPYKVTDFDADQAQFVEMDLISVEQFNVLNANPVPPRAPTFEEYLSTGRPWFEYITHEKAVKADQHSRLVALDQNNGLTALPAEAPLTVPDNQIIKIYSAGFFHHAANHLQGSGEAIDAQVEPVRQEP